MQNAIAQGLHRLQEEQNKGLQRCLQRIAQWTKFRDDYVALQKKLIELPDRVSHDVNVPFGSLAFMPGRMIHTNEIMVLLGDGWFVERSAKQAAEIVARRINDCDRNLSDLDGERVQYENWLRSTAEVQSDVSGGHEIVEVYDEQKEQLWKERHRLSVQKQKQLERASRSGSETGGPDDLLNKLDELERTESANDEISKPDETEELDASSSSSHDDSESDLSESSDENDAVDFVSKLSDEKPNRVQWSDLDSIGQLKTKRSTTLKVSFTRPSPVTGSESADRVPISDDTNEPCSTPCITSPADIFKQFGDVAAVAATTHNDKPHQLKSILKPSKASSSVATATPTPNSTVISTADSMELDAFRAENRAVSCTIVERDAPFASSTVKSDAASSRRTVSKFRAQRQAR